MHSYTASSRAVLTFEARINAETLRRDLKSQVSGLFPPSAGGLELFGGRFAGTLGFGGVEMSAIRAFPQLAMAIRRLSQEAAAGEPDVKAFRDQVARFANTQPENVALQALAGALLAATKDAASLQGHFEQARDVSMGLIGDQQALARALGEAAGGFAGAREAAKDFSATLAALRGQIPELATELRMRGLREQLNRGLAAIPSLDLPPHARAGAQAQLMAEFERAMAAMLANSPAARQAQAAAQAIDRVTDSLRFQIDQLSRTAREQAIYNQLAAAGVDINSEAGREIAALAGRLFDQEAAFDAAAKAAKDYQDELTRVQREQQQMLDQYRDIGRDAFLDLAAAIKDGSINARELLTILGRITDRLADMATNRLFDLLFGRRGSSDFGLVGSLFQNLSFGGGGAGGPSFVGTGFYHQGGVVGSTPVPVRLVDPSLFIGAPRLHRGLNNDEFPAILQHGERVIPRDGLIHRDQPDPTLILSVERLGEAFESIVAGVVRQGQDFASAFGAALEGMVPADVRTIAPEIRPAAPVPLRGSEVPILRRMDTAPQTRTIGDTITIDARTTIDARGADQAAIARLEAAAIKRERKLREDIPKLIMEARSQSRLR